VEWSISGEVVAVAERLVDGGEFGVSARVGVAAMGRASVARAARRRRGWPNAVHNLRNAAGVDVAVAVGVVMPHVHGRTIGAPEPNVNLSGAGKPVLDFERIGVHLPESF